MASIRKAFGLAALLASAATAAPFDKRDLVTDVTTAYDITYVTQWVTVPAGGAVATPSADAAAASAPAVSTVAAAATSAAPSVAAVSSEVMHYHSYGGGYRGGKGRPSQYSHGPAASSSAASSYVPSSSSIVPVPSSYAASSAPAPVSSSYAAPTSAAATSTPAYTPPASSSAVVSSAPAPSSSAPASGNKSKRGLAYNNADLLSLYSDANMGWAYNWGSSPSGSMPSGVEYVPLLWSSRSDFVESWNSNAQSAIDNGGQYLMSFNEPDHKEQANMSPTDAAAAYQQYMMPFAGKAKLGSPAVTNGGSPMGLTWLQEFTDACKGCQIDFTPIHWYDSATNIDYFKSHIEQAYQQTGKPIWVTEFGASGSDAQISQFMDEVIPWMDSLDYVQRYAYFMVGDGFLVNGQSLSSYGKTYATC